MHGKIGKTSIGFTVAIILASLLWLYLFSNWGMDFAKALNLKNTKETMSLVLSASFAFFIVAFPLSYALIVAATKSLGKKKALAVSITASLVAMAVAAFAFKGLAAYWIVGLFYILSVFSVIEKASQCFEEFRKNVSLRTMAASVSNGMTFIAIGLAALTVITIVPNQQAFVNGFEEGLFQGFGAASGEQAGLAESLADMQIKIQGETLKQVSATQQYAALKNNTDSASQEFVSLFDAISIQIGSAAYRQQVVSQLKQNASTTFGSAGTATALAEMKKRLPMLSTIEEFLWAFEALLVLSVFFLLANIIIKPLGTLYGALALQIIKIAP